MGGHFGVMAERQMYFSFYVLYQIFSGSNVLHTLW
uniref:Uncharacterized protein n=1 Tax=Anguilla anguilla TaxID=7936 RepID=A0A0E9U8Q7_ANGAN